LEVEGNGTGKTNGGTADGVAGDLANLSVWRRVRFINGGDVEVGENGTAKTPRTPSWRTVLQGILANVVSRQ
jgi:hypothetical protein